MNSIKLCTGIPWMLSAPRRNEPWRPFVGSRGRRNNGHSQVFDSLTSGFAFAGERTEFTTRTSMSTAVKLRILRYVHAALLAITLERTALRLAVGHFFHLLVSEYNG